MSRTSNTFTVRRIAAPTTILAQASAALSSGQWYRFGTVHPGNAQTYAVPTGINLFQASGASGSITGYALKMARNTSGQQIHFVGGDHGGGPRHLVYSEANHEWTAVAYLSSWSSSWHAYTRNAWDSDRGKFWVRGPTDNLQWVRWESGSTWTSFDPSSQNTYTLGYGGLEYFPGLGGNGRLLAWESAGSNPMAKIYGRDQDTGAWQSYGTYDHGGGGVINTGAAMHYSPQHSLLWFGGGNGNKRLYWMNSSGTVTQYADNMPSGLPQPGANNAQSLSAVNPANGHMLVMNAPGNWYEHNVLTNVWTQQGSSCQVLDNPVHDPAQRAWGTVACTIFEYGVIAFVKVASAGTVQQMWIYKP